MLVDNVLKKLKKFNLSHFRGKNYFGDNNINYLVFEASQQYIDLSDDCPPPYNAISSCDSIGASKEVIKPPRSNKNILSPIVEGIFSKEKVKFNGSCLVQD